MQADAFLIDEYASQHTTDDDEVLRELYRYVHLHKLNPRMAAGPVQGKLLEFICAMLKPKKVLEVGTFCGYSAICMAKALPEDGHLTTIEADPECEDVIRKFVEKASLTEKITLMMGDAKQIIPTLDDVFDLVFIDADKVSYPYYYEQALPKVKSGGFILADNVLWDGKVLDGAAREKDTQALQRFNDMVNSDDRVENVLLPLRDGLMVIRKR